MKRRTLSKSLLLLCAGVLLPTARVRATTYLSVDQAKKILWGETSMQPVTVELSKAQQKSIQAASKTRVRNRILQAWKTDTGGWFILDQVIGKHENIDIAVALTHEGKVKGIEILTYRETYGFEVRNPKWLAQFLGRDHQKVLKLDREIKNISGATLSCRHITDGINRLTHTWEQVLSRL